MTARPRLTEWYPPEVKPVHTGHYQSTVNPEWYVGEERNIPRTYWDGVRWLHDDRYPMSHQSRFWRGLARKP